jgi:hypothetical protein
MLRNKLQLHTIAGVHMHSPALQLVSKSTVYNKLLGSICGGTHNKIVDRLGGLSPKEDPQ